MDLFSYKGGRLYAEDVDVAEIAASAGTPLYIYSRQTILLHLDRLRKAFASAAPLFCYSVKANSNLSVLSTCVQAGTGFDIVSGGELYRALAAGARGSEIVYSGVGKTDAEINQALDADILFFNVESPDELEAIERIASARSVEARVSLRMNPDVDAHAHEYTTTGRKQDKFGIAIEVAEELARNWDAYPNCRLVGVDIHLGSQITSGEPYVQAIEKLLPVVETLREAGHDIEYFDIGGGFGIFYEGSEAKSADEMAAMILPVFEGTGLKLVIEPGRFVVGNAGILVTRVTYVKKQYGKRFVICDAGMNDLIRPAFYGSYHKMWPVESHVPFTVDEGDNVFPADVVGPICESGDFFAKERPLPHMAAGDCLSVFGAGAYGMVMASNYNARPRVAEVMVDGGSWKIVRRRETYDDLLAHEKDCDD